MPWASLLLVATAQAQQPRALDEVVVTATRESGRLAETPASIGVIQGESLRQDRPTHPSQLLGQIPGTAVAVTNGEGHTTAIRQPFTTSPVYLFLEDGVPIRSTGFFNHNALYEINLPQSGGVEVVRGPGTALYGSDAIGGVINVLTREPPKTASEWSASGEIGSFGWQRLLASGGHASETGHDSWRGSVNITHTDGWRDSTQYERQSGTFRWDSSFDSGATLRTVATYSGIDQQTGANSPLAESDYLNDPTRNYLPIAYRKVRALRLSGAYERENGAHLLSLTPYVRDDRMELLASFALNSDPTVSVDANRSFGVVAKWRVEGLGKYRARMILGADLDVSPGSREEDAVLANVTGSAPSRQFNAYTLAGRIYDYDVTFVGLSPYVHSEVSPTERWRITAGLRFDSLSYKFENHLDSDVVLIAAASGATNFPTGNRFYSQADSTTRRFSQLSPKFGTTFALNPHTSLFLSYNRGFRAPSQSQLFRPSSSANEAQALSSMRSSLDLKAIKASQIEVGIRGRLSNLSYDASIYDLKKQDDIVSQRDPDTTLSRTVNAGETRHRGVELGLGLSVADGLRIDVAATYVRHSYDDWVTSIASFSGNDIEQAPKYMGNARLTWQPRENGSRLQLEWTSMGPYWLDAGNTREYGGHNLLNLRSNWSLSPHWSIFGTVNNLLDRRYADSAQVSSNQPVLSPGLPRSYLAGVETSW